MTGVRKLKKDSNVKLVFTDKTSLIDRLGMKKISIEGITVGYMTIDKQNTDQYKELLRDGSHLTTSYL